MILEILFILQLIAGIFPLALGIFFFKKDPNVFLNQLLGISMSIMGISLVIDSFFLILNNFALYTLTEYIISFTLGFGVGCFFLSGIALVKGEEAKQIQYLGPIFFTSIFPGLVIALANSVKIDYVDIMGENIMVASWGELGDVLILLVFIIFFFGSLFFFYTVYPKVEDEIKERLKYFLAGFLVIGVSVVISNLLFVIVKDVLFGLFVTTLGTYGSISFGSLLIFLGFIRVNPSN